MSSLKEFANFITLHMADLTKTYVQLLAEQGEGYEEISIHSRTISARKLLRAVAEACETENSESLLRLFDEGDETPHRWPEAIKPPQPLLEVESLGHTLTPIVTNLEAGKFLWQILAEVRGTVLDKEKQQVPTFDSHQKVVGHSQNPFQFKEYYRLVLKNVPMAVAMFDENMRYIAYSDHWLQDYGLQEQEIIGRSHYDLFPEIGEDWKAIHRRCLEGAVEQHPADPFPRGDGTVDWVRWEIYPWHHPDSDGIGGILMFTEVITEQVQAENRLQRTQQVIENSPIVLFRWKAAESWPVEFVSENVNQFGYTREEIMSGEVPYASIVHPDDLERVAREVQEHSESGVDHFQQEYRIVTKDGNIRWTDDRTVIERDRDGNITHYQGIVLDVTEREQTANILAKRASELETVAELSTAVSTILDVDELLQKVADLTRDRFELYHAHIYLLNDAKERLNLVAGAGEVGRKMVAEGWSIPMNHESSLVVRAAQTHKAVIFNDVQESTGFLPNPLLPDTRSEMAVPMIVGNKVLGVLDVQADRVGRFTEVDIRIKTILASQIAVALQNADLYEQSQEILQGMQESEDLLRSVIDATPNWIFVKDRDHRYKLVNQSYADDLHIPVDEFVGKDDLDLGFPEDIVKGNPEKGIRGFWADDDYVFETGKPLIIDREPAVVDGQEVIFHTIKQPLYDAQGELWGVLGFAHDVTEREQLLAETETLYNIGAQLNAANTLPEIMDVAAKPGLESGAVGTTLFVFDLDESEQVERASCVAAHELDDEPPFSVGTDFDVTEFPFAGLLEETQPLLSSDVTQEDRIDPASRETLTQMDTVSAVVLPLNLRQRWVGQIIIRWTTSHTFTEGDERLYRSISAQTATVVNNRRLFEQTQRRAAQLEKISRIEVALSQAATEEEILIAIASHLQLSLPDQLVLQYLESDQNNRPNLMEVVAIWDKGAIQYDDPSLHRTLDPNIFSASNLWIEAPSDLFLVSDVQNDPRLDVGMKEMMAHLEVAAFAALPLRTGNQWQGLLMFNWSEPREYGDHDNFIFRRLLEPVAAAVTSRRAALAQEKARAESEQRAKEASIMDEVGQVLIAESDLGVLLYKVTDTLVEHFEAAFARIWTTDEFNENLILQASSGLYTRIDGTHSIIPMGKTKIGLIAEERSPYLSNDLLNDARLSDPEWAKRNEIVAFAGYPLIVGERLLGVLAMYSRQPLSDNMISILSRLAERAAIAIDNHRLLIETRQRARDLAVVQNITAAINTSENFAEGLATVREYLQEMMPVDVITVGAYKPGDEHFTLFALDQKLSETHFFHQGVVLPVEGTGPGWVLQNDDAWVDEDFREEQPFLEDKQLVAEGFASRALLPLRLGGQVIGTLNIASKKPGVFKTTYLSVLWQVADQTASALERSRLFEVTQRRAQREQTIREVTEKMRSATTLEELVKTTAEELGHHFSAEYSLVELGIDSTETNNQ